MPQRNSIQHFTHPGHGLTEFNADTEYLCNGCKIPGSGKRYRCEKCNFNLHDYCGTCPPTLSSFMHPHQLSMVIRRERGNRVNNRVCSLCCKSVEGLFYRCQDCDFDLHPMCSQWPERLYHGLLHAHPLKLEAPPSVASLCAACNDACTSWRYRCGDCGFDIHVKCFVDTFQQKNGAKPRRFGRMMLALVTQLGLGMISSLILGVDLSFHSLSI